MNPRTSSSISTFMLLISSCRARERPSLGAHSSAIILEVALANLEIQSPVVQTDLLGATQRNKSATELNLLGEN